MRKPIVLMTVCRRYHELQQNLKAVWERAGELCQKPEVVVVWARPEIGRLWIFQELQEQGLIQHLIGRPALIGEQDGVATTHPESHNLRIGLEFVKERYGTDVYVVGMAADVWPKPGIFSLVDGNMQKEGCEAVLFYLNTGIVHSDVWHTNFFSVGMDERYWPPLATKEDQDILERKWGLELKAKALPGIFEWHNNRSKSFVHAHQSESLPEVAFRHQKTNVGVSLFVTGRKVGLWERFVNWLLRRRRSSGNSC